MAYKKFTSEITNKIPQKIQDWFAAQNWQIREHQQKMIEAYFKGQSSLLIAPTGGGKTLAGFLPSLIDLYTNDYDGLHTLYISPLKALTNDIERNLHKPITEMGLNIKVESRTGDTPAHKRARQKNKPPHILLTTPESLMLMLSYVDADRIFRNLKLVIIDEIHSFATNKRGDFCSLALSRLKKYAPKHIRFGLSATVAKPKDLANWLGKNRKPAKIIQVKNEIKPKIEILETEARMPYGGHLAKYAIPEIYEKIKQAKTSIIFVNTRSQAELIFQYLWENNADALPIAIYHGSLSKEQRRMTENMMASNKIRAIVATSALELGIDWGDIDLVIQIGAPKGVSRLLQRIGRSNHKMNKVSEAVLVPANRFEALECESAINAIAKNKLDGDELLDGSQDVLVQYIMNCACNQDLEITNLYEEVISAYPYRSLSLEEFEAIFQFAANGGYVLESYQRFERLKKIEGVNNGKNYYRIASPKVARRHRQNIGVIVEAARLNVKKTYSKKGGGKYIGHVEEYFAQQLNPGDTFFFAGEILEYIRVVDMNMEVKPSNAREPKVPSYVGGQMPLSTFLADGVRALLNNKAQIKKLPKQILEWLDLQSKFSVLPNVDNLLVEHFKHQKRRYTVIYTFEGRKANQTLGMLMTKRMEKMGLKPLNFSITDYAISIMSISEIEQQHLEELFSPAIFSEELENWIMDSAMLKRSFRRVAIITGLTEQRHNGASKSLRQVTFSTDLIFEVLQKHEPNHVLLEITRADAERELLDSKRITDFLFKFENKITLKKLNRPSPMSIPILVDVKKEHIKGEGVEFLLQEMSSQEKAEQMMNEVLKEL